MSFFALFMALKRWAIGLKHEIYTSTWKRQAGAERNKKERLHPSADTALKCLKA